MTRFTAALLGMVLVVGCAAQTPPPAGTMSGRSSSAEPAKTEATVLALPQAEADLFPSVPLYPLATKQDLLADQRAFVEVKGEAAAKVLGWYEAAMPTKGWQRENTGLPADMVLLFSREGKYLSIAGHDAPDGHGSVLWLHLRTTREATHDDAVSIARNTHRVEANWTATLIQDFGAQPGAGVEHAVWLVEASPGNDAVWVDAITAEPFRIRQ